LVKIPASSRHTSFALKKAAKDFEKPVSFWKFQSPEKSIFHVLGIFPAMNGMRVYIFVYYADWSRIHSFIVVTGYK
jgi:hypothetical protein